MRSACCAHQKQVFSADVERHTHTPKRQSMIKSFSDWFSRKYLFDLYLALHFVSRIRSGLFLCCCSSFSVFYYFFLLHLLRERYGTIYKKRRYEAPPIFVSLCRDLESRRGARVL